MKQEDIDWLNERPNILGNTSVAREDLTRLFQIYNDVTGEKKAVTGCGRCILNTKKMIKMHYDKARSNN
jgi:hypothetical protein